VNRKLKWQAPVDWSACFEVDDPFAVVVGGIAVGWVVESCSAELRVSWPRVCGDLRHQVDTAVADAQA
jgi:hypothetical protein